MDQDIRQVMGEIHHWPRRDSDGQPWLPMKRSTGEEGFIMPSPRTVVFLGTPFDAEAFQHGASAYPSIHAMLREWKVDKR
jgi:hypothetical protein